MHELLKKAVNIEGFIKPEDLAIHLGFLEEIKKLYGVQNTFEIGFYKGRSSIIPRAFSINHYAIDYTVPVNNEPGLTIFYEDSNFLKEDLSFLFGQVDFMIIDGDHSYQSTKNDLQIASKLLSQNGILVVDDTNFKLPGVNEALSDFLKENKDFCIICKDDSETFLCRSRVWEVYYKFALLELPSLMSKYLDDLNLKVLSGDSFEASSFISHPYLIFEFLDFKGDLRVEYLGKRDYYDNPNTFVLLERKNLSYLNIKE